MKPQTKKILTYVLSFVLLASVCLFFYKDWRQRKAFFESERMTHIYIIVASVDIDKGMIITENMLKRSKIEIKSFQKGYLAYIDSSVGCIAIVDIPKGTVMNVSLVDCLMKTPSNDNSGVSSVLEISK